MLEVDNVRVRVRSAPNRVLWGLYNRLAYLSPSARDAGFQAPIEAARDAPDDAEYVWDGMVRFLRRPALRKDGSRGLPWFETGLLPRALAELEALGCPVQMHDTRARPDPNHDIPLFWPSAEKPLFEYQEMAVQAARAAGRGVIVAPPRAGKTIILLELFRRLNQPTLLIAPTTSIVDQTRTAALAYGYGPRDVMVLDADTKWGEARTCALWICTAAKAVSLTKEQAASRQIVACDELHHFTKGGTWGRVLHEIFAHVFHWFGASGTWFRSSGDDMALEAFLSGVVYSISSRELIALKRLVPTRVAFVPVVGPPLKRGEDPRKAGVLLHEHRNGLVAAAAIHLAATGRRVLVMVAVKEQGHRIAELINHHGASGTRSGWKFAEFLFRGRGGAQAARDLQLRRKLTAAFLDGSGPAVLIGTSLLGEGVDLPDADALVWARGESAAVSYLQGMYRVSTASPGKVESLAVDFSDRHNKKLLEASVERMRIAYADPTFRVSVLSSATDLAAWAGPRVA